MNIDESILPKENFLWRMKFYGLRSQESTKKQVCLSGVRAGGSVGGRAGGGGGREGGREGGRLLTES